MGGGLVEMKFKCLLELPVNEKKLFSATVQTVGQADQYIDW